MAQNSHTPTSCLSALRAMSRQELDREIINPQALRLDSFTHNGKRLDTVWAPFDYVNPRARVVIVGITPGHQQMKNALRSCHARLSVGDSDAEALAAAKVHSSFSGPMRNNLVDLLDDVGINRVLGLSSTAALWEDASELVQFTSALRYPVFVDGKNYSGQPNMLRQQNLSAQLELWMGAEMRALPNAIYVPLGPKVGEALAWLAPRVGVSDAQILNGLPHPSGASMERIAYWLRRKPREMLSVKTNADRLDAARAALLAKIAKLGGEKWT